jgi:hypothetical protein
MPEQYLGIDRGEESLISESGTPPLPGWPYSTPEYAAQA